LQEFEPGNVLEVEGTQPKFLYIMKSGEISFYKRPESLYNNDKKRIKINNLENMTNPKDSGK
jgi:CRP-like cAMP-binding protein